jgi:antitoxin MazE
VAQSWGIDENSVVELTESGDTLIISKKQTVPTLDEMLASIPKSFEYPDDVADFIDSEPQGDELL